METRASPIAENRKPPQQIFSFAGNPLTEFFSIWNQSKFSLSALKISGCLAHLDWFWELRLGIGKHLQEGGEGVEGGRRGVGA